MSVTKDKKNGYWQYEFMYKGVRYHRRFKGATHDEVVGYETVARSELRKSGYDIASENRVYMLSEIIADYKAYADNNYTRPKEAKRIIDNFYKVIGNKPAESVTLSDIEKYRSARKNEVKNNSINREVGNIRRMFSLAKSNKKLKVNPCDDLKTLRIEHAAKRFLTKEEERKLLKECNPVLRAIIIVALQTGMRCSEIKNLKWSDVYMEAGYMVALNPKNNRPRKLLITPAIKKELESMPKLSEYVFTNPITKTKYKEFEKTFVRTVKRTGIPHITFHELRHTAASRMNELGIDLATIQEYLDHADARTTQGYIHKPKKNILDAVKKLSNYT